MIFNIKVALTPRGSAAAGQNAKRTGGDSSTDVPQSAEEQAQEVLMNQRSEPPQARKTDMQSTQTGNATGQVALAKRLALAKKFANRKGGDSSTDVRLTPKRRFAHNHFEHTRKGGSP